MSNRTSTKIPKAKKPAKEEKPKEKSTKSSKKEKSSDKENGHRSTKKQKPRTPTPEPPKAVQADEYEYEDDFEDYEEDFEEDVEDEVLLDTTQKGRDAQQGEGTQQKAAEVVEENGSPESTQRTARADEYEVVKDEDDTPMLRRLRTAQGGRTPIRPPASVIQAKPNDIVEQIDRHPSAGRRIAVADTDVAMPMNFGSDGDLQRRYETLKQLIGLESVGFRVLERPPIRDYNLYLEIFGDSGKTQSYSQTGDDNVNEETQTDELNGNNIWTQHPPGDLFGCGTDADAHVVITDEDLAREDMNIFYKSSAGDPKLVDFVNTAAKVMLKYLGERKSAYVEMNNRSEAAFSSGYNVITLGQLSKGASSLELVEQRLFRSRCNVLLRPILEEHTVLCVFYVKDSVAEDLIQKSLLVEFFMDDIRPPKRVFVSEGEVKCCAYSPDGTVLFGGVADGSCVAWDLLEPAANYANEIPWPDSKDDIVLRSPAYDTSFLSSTFSSNNKTAACVSITIINNPKTQTYQVACLDECGTISVWSVLRDAQTADNLGSRPESTLAMGLTALLRPDSAILSSTSNPTFLIANCMMLNAKDPMHFIVGTDVGFLMTISRSKWGNYAGPRLYKSNMNVFGEVLCLKPSPFDEDVFVAGLSSGSISVHRTNHSAPLVILVPPAEARRRVVAIEWSPSYASILYSIHSPDRVVTWDLGKGQQPLNVSKLFIPYGTSILCTHTWFAKPRTDSTGISYMAIGISDGQVQLHALEAVHPIVDSSITSIIKILKKAGVVL